MFYVAIQKTKALAIFQMLQLNALLRVKFCTTLMKLQMDSSVTLRVHLKYVLEVFMEVCVTLAGIKKLPRHCAIASLEADMVNRTITSTNTNIGVVVQKYCNTNKDTDTSTVSMKRLRIYAPCILILLLAIILLCVFFAPSSPVFISD